MASGLLQLSITASTFVTSAIAATPSAIDSPLRRFPTSTSDTVKETHTGIPAALAASAAAKASAVECMVSHNRTSDEGATASTIIR